MRRIYGRFSIRGRTAALVLMLVLAGALVAVGGTVAAPTGLAHSRAGDVAPDVLHSVPNFPDSRDPT